MAVPEPQQPPPLGYEEPGLGAEDRGGDWGCEKSVGSPEATRFGGPLANRISLNSTLQVCEDP